MRAGILAHGRVFLAAGRGLWRPEQILMIFLNFWANFERILIPELIFVHEQNGNISGELLPG